jgi:hypothetical protein
MTRTGLAETALAPARTVLAVVGQFDFHRVSHLRHRHMVALFFLYYNFCRVHSTLRVTPAMEAGISDHVWTIEELCGLLPDMASATKRIDTGLILKALGDL